jgi:hypothetical protein
MCGVGILVHTYVDTFGMGGSLGLKRYGYEGRQKQV